MKDPWTCSECGGEMVRATLPIGRSDEKSKYLVCLEGHGRLHPAPTINDLPVASRAIYRTGIPCRVFPSTQLFQIDCKDGLWKYIPHAHETALDKRPGPGVVIARVLFKGGRIEARAFRRAGRWPKDAEAQGPDHRPLDLPSKPRA